MKHIKALENKVRKLSAKQELRSETFERRYYTLLRKNEASKKQMLCMTKSAYTKEHRNTPTPNYNHSREAKLNSERLFRTSKKMNFSIQSKFIDAWYFYVQKSGENKSEPKARISFLQFFIIPIYWIVTTIGNLQFYQ